MESILCPAGCGRLFQTTKARESHVTQSQSCSWWRKYEKSSWTQELEATDDEPLGPEYMERLEEEKEEEEEELVEVHVGELEADLLQEYEEDHDIFHFVPLEPEIGEQGPGPSTQANRLLDRQLGTKLRTLDDNNIEDEQVIEWKKKAGTAIKIDKSLRERWRIAHNLEADIPMDGTGSLPDKLYFPFASEMDWRIAEWVVKDGIGHKSFDRLLAIPGVSHINSLAAQHFRTSPSRWLRN